MEMINYAITILLTSLMSAFIILLLTKIGVIEWVQIHGIGAKSDKLNELFSKLASCHFCLSFWTSVLIVLIAAPLTNNFELLFMPIFTAPLTRMML